MNKPSFSNWSTAEKHLSLKSDIMSNLISKYGPCSLEPRVDFFASLCESIISQQLATKAADAINRRFTAYYNYKVGPELILSTSIEQLRQLGLSNQKCNYIFDLAAKFQANEITPNAFFTMSDQEIIDQLINVKGIGIWTAQIFLIFALNRPDVFPADDLGLKKALQNLYLLDALPNKTQIENLTTPFKPYRTTASWYLWRSLENK
ncbi:DNA-3-methyladenine glycosylase family protein [Dendrosporobacter sp. 1207_IL3150]|uniref:DNA-3-methyladenine glycosylase family protein n=1 Tax=Dendrosporobacter sp. 1207_IL3150 TaxID=3084054 RepID=UPI002FD902EE